MMEEREGGGPRFQKTGINCLSRFVAALVTGAYSPIQRRDRRVVIVVAGGEFPFLRYKVWERGEVSARTCTKRRDGTIFESPPPYSLPLSFSCWGP